MGELSGDVLRDFEMKMKTDQDFANEVNLYKSIDETMKSHFQGEEDRKNLKITLDSVGSKYFKEDFNEKNTTKVNKSKIEPKETNIHSKDNAKIERERGKVVPFYQRRAFQRICAVAAVLLFAMIFFNPFKQNATLSELANANQELPVFPDRATRSDLSRKDSLFIEAGKKYKQRDFKGTLVDLERILQNDTDTEALFFKGVAKLELDQTEEAIDILKKISNGTSSYRNDSRWQLALYYLKIEDVYNCKEILKQIKKGDKLAKAKNLLKDLKGFQ